MAQLAGIKVVMFADSLFSSGPLLSGEMLMRLYAGGNSYVNLFHPVQGSQGRSSKEDDELAELAAETLVRSYREQAPAKLPLVQELLKSQGLPARA